MNYMSFVSKVRDWKNNLIEIEDLWYCAVLFGYRITPLKNGSFCILDAHCTEFIDTNKSIQVTSYEIV